MQKEKYKKILHQRTPSQEEKKAYRKVVQKAKANFFQKKIYEACKAKEAFEISKWHRSIGHFRIPPLIDPLYPENGQVQSPEGKREVLARNLLQNQSGVEDIPFSSPTVALKSLPFPQITDFEVSNAILGARNTAPGKDGVPSSVIRLSWPHISKFVTDLFQKCIEAGYHPHYFRTAVLAIIQKPKKVDLSSPRSYRPIAFLSVLGKGLERLIAKRMSLTAIKYGVLSRQQFGALPLRSSVDLTTCLTHDVEIALSKGLTASVATLDIKGAFDAVLPGKLVRRLREQGWACDRTKANG